ncbi:MAG TPA: hypothetical protein VFS81_25795, partial [Candidatus Binatia bacterium]|nr:hypothetical protein [Candidatus Binatia bacterium]
IFLIPVTFYVVEKLVHGERPPGGPPTVHPPESSQQTGDGELSRGMPRPALSPTHARERESESY